MLRSRVVERYAGLDEDAPGAVGVLDEIEKILAFDQLVGDGVTVRIRGEERADTRTARCDLADGDRRKIDLRLQVFRKAEVEGLFVRVAAMRDLDDEMLVPVIPEPKSTRDRWVDDDAPASVLIVDEIEDLVAVLRQLIGHDIALRIVGDEPVDFRAGQGTLMHVPLVGRDVGLLVHIGDLDRERGPVDLCAPVGARSLDGKAEKPGSILIIELGSRLHDELEDPVSVPISNGEVRIVQRKGKGLAGFASANAECAENGARVRILRQGIGRGGRGNENNGGHQTAFVIVITLDNRTMYRY